MSGFIAGLTATLTDEVMADAAAEKTPHVLRQSSRHVVKTARRAKGWLRNSYLAVQPFIKWTHKKLQTRLVMPKPVPALWDGICRLAPVKFCARRGLVALQNPYCRNAGIIGGIVVITGAMGFGAAMMGGAVFGAYALKVASCETLAALGWAWQRHVRKDRRNTKSLAESCRNFKIRPALAHLGRTAFGGEQKNPYLNALDAAMTVTSGVLLLPLLAQWQQNIGRMLAPVSLRQAGIEQLHADNAAVVIANGMSSGERGLAQITLRQAGGMMMQPMLQQEAAQAGNTLLARVGQALANLPERVLVTAEQAGVKALGTRIANHWGRELAM